MERRTEFIYASLLDLQSTIRSIDVRAGFIFLILFSPLAVADKILGKFAELAKAHAPLTWAVIGCAVVWCVALATLFLTASAISDPAAHVSGDKPRGRFYGGDLFRFETGQLFRPRCVMSARSVEQELSSLPGTEAEVQAELVFEKLKLTYIRDLKLTRYNLSVFLTAIWLCASIVVMTLVDLPA